MAAPTCLRSLSRNCSEAADTPSRHCPWAHFARKQVPACAADAPPHRCPWAQIARNRCSLASATGLFSSNGSFWLVQREWPGTPSREILLRDSTQYTECLLHCELGDIDKSSRTRGHAHMQLGGHSCKVVTCSRFRYCTHGHTHGQTRNFLAKRNIYTIVPIRSAKYVTRLIPTRFSTWGRPRHIA